MSGRGGRHPNKGMTVGCQQIHPPFMSNMVFQNGSADIATSTFLSIFPLPFALPSGLKACGKSKGQGEDGGEVMESGGKMKSPDKDRMNISISRIRSTLPTVPSL